MLSPDVIFNKKILIVVAHPDDETLWFYQCAQMLKKNNDVRILCVTYSSDSERGMELQAVADKVGLKVLFGECADTGIDRLLSEKEVQKAFESIFLNFKFDLLITHPPHGGEKPHPHHIQLYLLANRLSQSLDFQFGFFSEKIILRRGKFNQCLKMTTVVKLNTAVQLMHCFSYLKNEEKKFSFFLKILKEVFSDFSCYRGYSAVVDVNLKQSLLRAFSSQEKHLIKYKAFYQLNEYFFIRS